MTEHDREQHLEEFIKSSLAEDIGEGDHTTLATIPINKKGKATLIMKEAGVLAGVDIALRVFHTVDEQLEVKTFRKDGDIVQVGDQVLEVSGNIHGILKAERLVLNIMQRMSGIATVTHRISSQLSDTGTQVLDTRKTTPGMRVLEKQAVKIGGGENHRFGLYDMILIKDNHIDFCGGIKQALDAAINYRSKLANPIQIEIEVRNLKELQEVIDHGGPDRILLDNFDSLLLKDAVKLVDGRFITEASGGITESNAREYALTGVNFISMGALTHSVKSLDMSLKA
ncbi:nicotinate-nucleotide pyrophosphorylase [carboxylating] [bacterium A37T11]|nr:nicotinate-nucleotide pyrophosphorylase [carboxylating] [bacterium A37T11]